LKSRKQVSKDPLNRWRSSDSSSFVQWPAWWRTFVYHVLTPREVTVYLYVTSHVKSARSITFVPIREIRDGVGLRSDSIVRTSLEKLVELGFLLRFPVTHKTLRQARMKVALQRPRVHHTLITLLARGQIDERLLPIKAEHYTRESVGRDPQTDPALKGLFRNTYAFGLQNRYDHLQKHLANNHLTDKYGPVALSVFLEAVLNKTGQPPDPLSTREERFERVRDYVQVQLDLRGVPTPENLWLNAEQRRKEASRARADAKDANAALRSSVRAVIPRGTVSIASTTKTEEVAASSEGAAD